jgi:hypothetical protein
VHSLGITASHVAALQFVGTSSATAGSVTLPSNLQTDDLLIVMVLNNSNGVDESGWTVGGSGTSGGLRYDWYWKYFVSGDTTFTLGDGTDPIICAAFRNVDPIYPFDATPTTADGGGANAGDPNAPSITTVNPSSLVVILGWQDDDLATFTAPSGYRLISTLGESSNGSIGMAFKEVNSPSAEDPAAFGSSGSDDWAAVSIALRSKVYGRQMVAYSSTGTLVHTFGGYKYHVFTSSTATFHVVSTGSVDKIEVLCVAGGGGGGEGASGGGGGGGGAGGVEMLAVTPSATNYAISIGAGGAGSTVNTNRGSTGSDSSFASTVVSTLGGGGGGSSSVSVINGGSGGSGSGGAATSSTSGTGGSRLVSGEGSNGGSGIAGNGGGGGGGAGGTGGTANTTDTGGTGGAGTADYSTWFTDITSAGGATYGENGSIASGGGGGGDVTGGTSPDGGGANGTAGATNATAATANTGGGGGGSETGNGSNGGSGIVIVRYRHVALG